MSAGGAQRPHGSALRSWGQDLLDLLLPPACAGCGRPLAEEAPLCRACDRSIVRASGVPPVPGLSACVAAAELQGAAEDWIHRFKYPAPGLSGLDPGPPAVARALVLEAAARAPAPRPGLVLPVPLHPRRLRSRGFSPPALLARALARRLRLPFDPVALRRVRDTPSQTGLDRSARRRNVRDAFEARPGRALPDVVWLVDDVFTTGSTLAEAARALRRVGPRQVIGLCAAWTPAKSPQR